VFYLLNCLLNKATNFTHVPLANIKMNITKYLIILFLILPKINSAQEKSELDCKIGFETIDTEIETQKTVTYKIISSRKLYTKESFEFSEGIIVISDLNNKLNSNEIVKTIATIGLKNNLSKMTVFKTCDAIKIYFQGVKPTSEQKKYLEENLIGKVNLDLYKSLSRKEKRRNKRKRELIGLVSKEACEKIENEKISKELIGQIISKTSAQYVKKIEKAYELPFEKSTIEFMKDLINYLIIDCESVKELTNEKND
jgi:hypothetical protein